MVCGSIIISTLLSSSFCHICRPLRDTDSCTAHITSTANHATSVSSAPAYSIFFLRCRSIPPTHLSIVSTGNLFQHSESNQTSTTAPHQSTTPSSDIPFAFCASILYTSARNSTCFLPPARSFPTSFIHWPVNSIRAPYLLSCTATSISTTRCHPTTSSTGECSTTRIRLTYVVQH